MKLLALLLCAAVFTGCASREDKQNASNAIEGVNALESAASQVDPESAAAVASGTRGFIAAAVQTKQDDLPEPTVTADDPQAYQAAGEEAEEEATKGFWRKLMPWLGGLGLTALGVLKFIPGAHQPLVRLVRPLFESRVDKQARERQEALAMAAPILMDAIDHASAGEAKSYVERKVPSRVRDAINEYLQSKSRKPEAD